MILEVLVEERSAEAALGILIPKIVGPEIDFEIHSFEGKRDLLQKLPSRLRGYARWIASGVRTRILVLVDEDRQDCISLKAQLEQAASDAGLVTKSASYVGDPFVVLNRVAVEELEAWFFGDCAAIRAAYPGVPRSLEGRAAFRTPDAISGGTWERLEQVLSQAGHHRGGLRKIQAARDIAFHMEPTRNSSTSFRHLCSGLEALTAGWVA